MRLVQEDGCLWAGKYEVVTPQQSQQGIYIQHQLKSSNSSAKVVVIVSRNPPCTLQMKGRWESKINVWFPFTCSKQWNCTALLSPTQNYNVLSPNFRIHVSLIDSYIPRICQSIWLGSLILGIYTVNCLQIHECRNWGRGSAVHFLGINKPDFRYSVGQTKIASVKRNPPADSHKKVTKKEAQKHRLCVTSADKFGYLG